MNWPSLVWFAGVTPGAGSHLNVGFVPGWGFELVAQTLHHLCRATFVALHCVAFFPLRFEFRSVARESRCLKKGPVAPVWEGGVAPQLCIDHKIVSQYRGAI